MQKPTKLYKKYITILETQNILSEATITSLKSRISTNKCSLTSSEVHSLKNMLEYNEYSDKISYNITQEHSDRGITYLKDKCFTLKGKPRRTKQVSGMPDAFFKAIEDFDHFTFVGYTQVDVSYFGREFYMPVWRIHTKSGHYFDYYMSIELTFDYLDYNIPTTNTIDAPAT